MDHGPPVSEEIDAGAELAREFDRYAPLKAAFWLKASDEDERYLYLASDRIDDSNFDLAYGEVSRLIDQIQSPYLDPLRMKIIGGENPLAQEAAEVNRRFPGRVPSRFGGRLFGGLFIADGYVCPDPIPIPAPA